MYAAARALSPSRQRGHFHSQGKAAQALSLSRQRGHLHSFKAARVHAARHFHSFQAARVHAVRHFHVRPRRRRYRRRHRGGTWACRRRAGLPDCTRVRGCVRVCVESGGLSRAVRVLWSCGCVICAVSDACRTTWHHPCQPLCQPPRQPLCQPLCQPHALTLPRSRWRWWRWRAVEAWAAILRGAGALATRWRRVGDGLATVGDDLARPGRDALVALSS